MPGKTRIGPRGVAEGRVEQELRVGPRDVVAVSGRRGASGRQGWGREAWTWSQVSPDQGGTG